VAEPEKQITLYQIVFAIWAAGAAAVLLWYLFSHWRFLRWLRRWGDPVINAGTIRLFNELGDKLELNRRPELLVCTGLKVPVLAGVFSSRLLLPEGEMGEHALRYSILHELTHFKRRDIWLKTLALLVNAIHWFNPFMWYMTRLVERDTELACDEAALKLLPAEEHKAYGTTILDAVGRLKTAQ
jgi:beta-lactamase regulating signal transducer with metallopeptidase domain